MFVPNDTSTVKRFESTSFMILDTVNGDVSCRQNGVPCISCPLMHDQLPCAVCSGGHSSWHDSPDPNLFSQVFPAFIMGKGKSCSKQKSVVVVLVVVKVVVRVVVVVAVLVVVEVVVVVVVDVDVVVVVVVLVVVEVVDVVVVEDVVVEVAMMDVELQARRLLALR